MLRAEARATFTMVYRGYDIEVSRGHTGWRAGVFRGALICPSYTAAKYTLPIKMRR